jgi:HIRAN domain-containing protein
MEGQPKPEKRQVVLRAGATEPGIAAELLMLLETVTADGHISDTEAVELRDWLDLNRESNLPSIEFLRTTLFHILADGRVTTEERKALHLAVERVLPVELRQSVKAKRQATELVEKAQQREERTAERNRTAEERERNRRIDSANFMVAGVSHEGRASIVDRFLRVGQTVYLVREPSNQFDPNAIEIRLASGHQIGHVPRGFAVGLAPVLDAGCKQMAYCTKILEGRIAPIPVVQADLYPIDASVRGAVDAAQIPARTSATTSNRPGCGCGTAAASVVVLVLLFVAIYS